MISKMKTYPLLSILVCDLVGGSAIALTSAEGIAGAAGDTFYSQGLQSADSSLARRIRDDLAKDNSLSKDAKNVTILVKDGKVTLSGAVKTLSEKRRVERLAQLDAGSDSVFNNLTLTD